jgi:exopolysaccharide biosynthesis protein
MALSFQAATSSGEVAEGQTNRPFPGVVIYTQNHLDPPNRLFIAEIDLTHPHVRVRVAPGGPDPDGPGNWQTTLLAPTRIATREKFDLVVNGDFFRARGVKDAEGTNSRFRGDLWAAAVGPAVTDGKMWAASTNARPCLVVRKDRAVRIEMLSRPGLDDWEVVAGNTMLVEAGVLVPHQNKARHPRTLAGLNATGTKLVLVVADGRKPGVAVGLSYEESATEMLRLGCHRALNLDGGGSSVMAVRDAVAGKWRILNEPSDGRERAVANVLGVSVNGSEDN